MQQLGFLLFSVLLPIFLQIGAGYALQKRFPLNTATLSKVQFYIFIPAITFTSLYATRLDTQLLGRILLANLLLIDWLGFVFAATAQFVLVAAGFGSRRPGRDLLIGLAVTLSAFLAFDKLLGVNIGAGILEGIL